MILSSKSIISRLNEDPEKGGITIKPYSAESQQPASYDLRSADEYLLACGEVSLVSSMEVVKLPVDLAATLMCRSSFGRKGILIGGGFVDPGFRGHLTLCLINMGSEPVLLSEGDRVVQMIIHEVTDGDDLYCGKYQDSIGAVKAR